MLARGLAESTGTRFDGNLVRKVRPTKQLKFLPADEKVAALEGAYELTERVDGETIMVVDDLLQSGTTLAHIANLLRENGAATVIGFTATKTLKD